MSESSHWIRYALSHSLTSSCVGINRETIHAYDFLQDGCYLLTLRYVVHPLPIRQGQSGFTEPSGDAPGIPHLQAPDNTPLDRHREQEHIHTATGRSACDILRNLSG